MLEADISLKQSYVNTKYYRRYYLPEQDKQEEAIEQLKEFKDELIKQKNELKSQIALNNVQEIIKNKCPVGYIWAIDGGVEGKCYPECDDGSYCETGQCFNDKCVICPSGTSLAIDGRCYST